MPTDNERASGEEGKRERVTEGTAPAEANGGASVAGNEKGIVEEPLSSSAVADVDAAIESVVSLVGTEGGAKFRKAISLTLSAASVDGNVGEEDGERLRESTKLFVELLSGVAEDKQSEAGFGELLLGYGRALVGFVRRQHMGQGVLGDAVEKKEEQEEEDIGEEEDDDEELAWTQLEAARVVFEALGDGYKSRLGEVHGALGDLLLESDEWQGAAREFGRASELVEGRHRAEVLYKRYLALRREKAEEAVAALRESVAVFERVAGMDEETLKDMRAELENYSKAVTPAIKRVQQEQVEVKVVQPRKRARKET